jgi:hypothetical protein
MPVRAHATGIHCSSHSPTRIVGRILETAELGQQAGLTELVFHIPNLSHFYAFGADAPRDRPVDRIDLTAAGWHIEISPVENIDDLEKELKETGGYAITHVARSTRADGDTFDSKQARDLASALYYFLSFVEGNWTGGVLPFALSGNDAEWQAWAPLRVAAKQAVLSWADHHHAHLLPAVFNGYMRRFTDSSWRETVGHAIFWYIESNRNKSGLEAGIILLLSALDTLAWQYLVIEQKTLSKTKFKGLSAAERLRSLCAAFGIPLSIPNSCGTLNALVSQLGWADLADAVTDVRNNIVHPDAPGRNQLFTSQIMKDAWICGTWVLELALLWLFDFRGDYFDRRRSDKFVGNVSRVPWA